MTTSSPPPHQPPPPPPPQQPYHDPPLGVPLLLPAPPLPLSPPPPSSSSSSRRLPPPCWTPEETSALIDFYREKWYSLRRGNLRAAHWQEVAADIHRSCPDVSPPKTAVQCRHKMEKLRKRYRAELQRAQSIPHHRFSSSWVYFYKMDAMEKGDNGNYSSNNRNDVGAAAAAMAVAVAPVNFVVNGEVVKDYNGNYYNVNDNCVGFDDMNVNYGNVNGDDDDVDGDGDGDEGYGYGSEFRKDYQRNGLKIKIAGNSRKSYGGFEHVSNSNPNPRFGRFSEFSTPSPPLARPQFEEGMRFSARDLKNGGGCGGSGSGGSSGGSFLGSGMGMNAVMKKRRSALGKRGREDEREEERGRGKGGDGLAAMEMVEAIRVMGEGFMRVEQMKMEMVRESERERMEYEMKRTQMILESQRRIVEAFTKGWSELVVNNGDNNDNDVRNDDGKGKDES